MLISLVVAAAENSVIGSANQLPWRLPDDLRRFKSLTMGKPIVMGRKTFESIGKPLPGRMNVVVTRRPELKLEGCVMATSLDTALEADATATEVMVIGGADIYRQVLPRTDRIYLTRVHAHVEGDAYFPDIVWEDWIEAESDYHPADERHRYPFTFLTLKRSHVV